MSDTIRGFFDAVLQGVIDSAKAAGARISSLGAMGHRMGAWLFTSGAFLILLIFVAPQQLGVIVQKVPLITIGAWIGFRLFRGAFPYVDVKALIDAKADPAVVSAAMNTRGVIVAACVLGMALAL